ALGHDLPNQLVSVQGFARLLESELGTSASEDVRQLLERLANLARKADEHMRGLAGIGRLLRASDVPEPIHLGELVRDGATDAVSVFNASLVAYDLSKDWPVLSIERARLHRALTELLRNAFQAAASEQRLKISLSAFHDEAGRLAPAVTDNGRGMSE